ncbi:MAG: 16S rRNA (cytosine(1402)-N(4))-methyltransferase [Acidocella sp. 20-57-95]|nr:MAG: 16S rRNA (cytosine(1402)-N(4))-methyltransferase [Acidocella sp. 20-57-95]OYV60627.1 MAG: 16S rRNA (cytosine(1402)-N(4))-methyltransferase [Acidocella sp. 21-58-7]HQT63356.1 16S rRNA (cytosine(1402)-N(4))-methyltransferase RsmH [Acidocella sp.]HQU03207.1 16S rRNA (cytosine(1402)-N(4))-methyltransferase RsmH [Acidocella sp.]
MSAFSHIPVLRDEAVAMLRPESGKTYLDGTFGGGGYARTILDAAACTLWAIDRDPAAIARGALLAANYPNRLHLLQGRIGELLELLGNAGVASLDGAVFDLGVSSYQIDDPARGFSFRQDGPLDMRMGTSGVSAAHLVNTLPESELADILYEFGEEKASRRIAKAIIDRRQVEKFQTTLDLAKIIRSVVRPDKSGIDPATRSFQALRIAVNEELSDVEAALTQAASLLTPGGRLVVVSFHSLEDRIVKRFMAGACGRTAGVSRHAPTSMLPTAKPFFKLLTGSPVTASDAEAKANPRARSAKLRAMERLAA